MLSAANGTQAKQQATSREKLRILYGLYYPDTQNIIHLKSHLTPVKWFRGWRNSKSIRVVMFNVIFRNFSYQVSQNKFAVDCYTALFQNPTCTIDGSQLLIEHK